MNKVQKDGHRQAQNVLGMHQHRLHLGGVVSGWPGGSPVGHVSPEQVHVKGGAEEKGELNQQQRNDQIAQHKVHFPLFEASHSILHTQRDEQEEYTDHEADVEGEMMGEVENAEKSGNPVDVWLRCRLMIMSVAIQLLLLLLLLLIIIEARSGGGRLVVSSAGVVRRLVVVKTIDRWNEQQCDNTRLVAPTFQLARLHQAHLFGKPTSVLRPMGSVPAIQMKQET